MQENMFDNLMYHAGLTAQGSMDHMDAYDRAAIEKYGQLIVQECAELFKLTYTDEQYARRIDKTILKHFGMYAE